MIDVELRAWREVRPHVTFVVDRGVPFAQRSDESLPEWQQLRDEYAILGDRQRREHPVIVIGNEAEVGDAVALALDGLSHPLSSSGTLGR